MRNALTGLRATAHRIGPCIMEDMAAESCAWDDDSLSIDIPHPVGISRPFSKTPSALTVPRAFSIKAGAGLQSNPLIEASYVVAICESRGTCTEIGVAAIDTRTSECIISQFSDCSLHIRTAYFLNLYAPKRILLCASSSNENAEIVQLLKSMVRPEDICIIPRRHFNDLAGNRILDTYSIESSTSGCTDKTSKYFCLSSLQALFNYLEGEEKITFRKNSLKITFKTLDGCMFIDSQTAAALELVASLKDKKSKKHLLAVMNYTSTAMGYRMLRLQLLQPPLDIGTVRFRQEFVEELLQSEETLYELKGQLKSLIDIEVLIGRMIHVPSKKLAKNSDFKVANVLALKQVVNGCEALQNLLSNFTNDLAQTIISSLQQSEFAIMKEKIDEIILPDCTFQRHGFAMNLSKINAVRPGIDELLDMHRDSFNNLMAEIDKHVNKCSNDYGLALKCLYSQRSGFSMTLSGGNSTAQLPKIFVNVFKNKGKLHFTTLELIKLNNRLMECSNEIYIRSNVLLSELLDEIGVNLSSLYVISGSIMLLDFIISLAFYRISNREMCKPQFSDTLAVKASRHPILDSLNPSFVPNNIMCYDGFNFQILIAPNMSGKTTYLKQVALIVVMSFIGSWVPASFASMRTTDKILSRFRNSDDIGTNSSTFMTEMKDMAFILNNLTSKSLVLIDELGRGTSKTDGFGITFAICEKLIKERCFVYFATHFSDLADFFHIYPNVHQMTFECSLKDTGLFYDYVIRKGACTLPNYGIKLAEKLGFDAGIIRKAYELSNEIKEQRDYQKHLSNDSAASTTKNQTIAFAIKMQHIIKNSALPRSQLVTLLRQKVNEFSTEH